MEAAVDIASSYTQGVGFIAALNMPNGWPDSWTTLTAWTAFAARLEAFNFDIAPLPKLDFRAQFLILAAIFPLVFAFVILIMIRGFLRAFWYVGVNMGIAISTLGIALLTIEMKFVQPGLEDQAALITGVGVTFLVGTVGTSLYTTWKKKKTGKVSPYTTIDEENEKNDAKEEKQETPTKPTMLQNFVNQESEESADLDRALSGQAQVVVGAKHQKVKLLLGILLPGLGFILVENPFQSDLAEQAAAFAGAAGSTIGSLLLLGGIVFFCLWILGLSEKGRRIHQKITFFFKRNMVRVMLVIVSMTYMPVCGYIFVSWSCEEHVCPIQSRFIEKHNMPILESYILTENVNATLGGCVDCVQQFMSCPTALLNDLCPGVSDSRLIADTSLSCDIDLGDLYAGIPVLVAISFALTIPVLYLKLINFHSANLRIASEKVGSKKSARCHLLKHASGPAEGSDGGEETKLTEADGNAITGNDIESAKLESAEDICYCKGCSSNRWFQVLKMSQNTAWNLYGPFEFRFRHYKFVTLFSKLILVGVASTLENEAKTASIIMGTVHFLTAVISLFAKPYINPILDKLAAITSACLAITAIFAAAVAFGAELGDEVVYALLALNIISIIGAIVVGVMLLRREKATPRDDLDKKSLEIMRDVDVLLDKKTNVLTSNAFTFMGVMGLIVVCLSAVSVASDSLGVDSTFFDYNTHTMDNEATALEMEFAGYGNWDTFVDNCCCEDSTIQGQATNANILFRERWRCRNGHVKDRLRGMKTNSVSVDGLQIRGMCERKSITLQWEVNIPKGLTNGGNRLTAVVDGLTGPPEVVDFMRTDLW